MASRLEIIPATVDDIDDLEILVHFCYRSELSKKGWTTEAGMFENPRVTKDELASDLVNPKVTIFKCHSADKDSNSLGRIIACAKAEHIGHKIHTGMISVHPELQNGGLGRKLLEKVNSHAADLGCDVVEIGVLPNRKTLVEWYERRGFVRTGQFEAFEFVVKGKRTMLQLVVLEQPVQTRK